MNTLSAVDVPHRTRSARDLAAEPSARNEIDAKALRRRRVYLEGTDRASLVAISAYKRLRTSLMLKLDALEACSVMVTSTTRGIGKSTTAVNLAINLARHPSAKVLLLDLDFRASSMAAMLGIEHDYGLERVADPDFSLVRARVDIGVPGLTVFPAGSSVENSAELLVGEPMLKLLEVLGTPGRGLTVVIDCPPILGCDDVRALAPHMPCALLVLEEGRTRRAELAESLPALGRCPIAGVVMNKSTTTKFSDYYY